ncbi:MAG: tetratricopeptide repeat protein [Alphaproteobacteria bacterium]
MLFWLLAALLTIGVLVVVFWPVAVHQNAPSAEGAPGRRTRYVMLALAAAVPVLAMATYLADGRPDLPDRPYAKREAERVAAGLPSDRERALVNELAAQMGRHPENAQGWSILGDAYVREGRFEEAAAAFGNALAIKPGDPELSSALGEARTLQAGGEVTAEAESAFRDALKADGAQYKARFFLALAKAQRGEGEAAKADLAALLSEAPANAPWRGAVEAALARLKQDPGSRKSPGD